MMTNGKSKLIILHLILFANNATSVPGAESITTDNHIDGLICSLRPEKVFWFEGQSPMLKVGLRNKSADRLYVILEPAFAELAIDGQWLKRMSNMMPRLFPFPPGAWYDDVAISASASWCGSDRHRKLLTPGEHTIQVAFFVYSNDSHFSSPPVAKVVSNPVLINILPQTGSSPERGVFFQSSLEFDKEIAIETQVGRRINLRTPGYSPRTIKFEKTGQDIRAVLNVKGRTSPKTKWQTTLELLDNNGIVLAAQQKNKETSGRKTIMALIAGGSGSKTFRQHFHFKNNYRGNAARFRVSFTHDERPREDVKDDGKGVWGKPVAGMQCRITPETASSNGFEANIRYVGSRFYSAAKITPNLCELSIDGQWYSHKDTPDRFFTLEHGDKYDRVFVTMDNNWCRKTDHLPLKLTPGKHTIQLAFAAGRNSERPIPPVWFLSKEIEIDIPQANHAPPADQKTQDDVIVY